MNRKPEKWYRIFSTPGVEYRFAGRNPDRTHRMVVRSTADPSKELTFNIVDPNGPKDMYLIGAANKFIQEIEERDRQIRHERASRPIDSLPPTISERVQREPSRAPEGSVGQSNEAAELSIADPDNFGNKSTQVRNAKGGKGVVGARKAGN